MAFVAAPPPINDRDIPEYLMREMQQVERAFTNDTWINLSLDNSWASFGTPYPSASFMKDITGRVWFRGLISGGTTTDGTALFTMPTGYRPAYQVTAPVLTNPNALLRIDIDSSGVASIETTAGGTAGSWISLDGLSFMAEN